ncbi:MAG TPA: hypothetical protein PKW30_01595 [Campylobacterales bacterium]|nr:hypothetical protein [Campylobacterales bacterium]
MDREATLAQLIKYMKDDFDLSLDEIKRSFEYRLISDIFDYVDKLEAKLNEPLSCKTCPIGGLI